MLKHKGLLSVLLVIVFLATTGCMLFFGLSDSVSAGGIIIPLPTFVNPVISIPPLISFPPGFFTITQWSKISNDSGLGSFHSIGGLAVNDNNILAVGNVESADRYIQYYDGSNWILRTVGFIPNYLEWGNNGVLYAATSLSGRIYKSSNPMDANPTWKNISADSGLVIPGGMTINNFGDLFVVDKGSNCIRKYDGSEWTVIIPSSEAIALTDIATTGTNLFVTDSIMDCIYVKYYYSPVWTLLKDSTYINSPNSIAADSEGNLFFVSDLKVGTSYKRSIIKYDGSNYSVFVPNGSEIGNISTVLSGYINEEIAIGPHDKLFYGDNGYTRVIKEKCNISAIDAISINGEYLQMTAGQKTFNWSVEAENETALINLFPTCPYATWGGDYNNSLNFGLNTFVVSCIAENDSRTDYTVNITRELSDNALLSEITVDSVPISGFIPNIFAYTGINVPFSETSVEIDALPQDSNATVTGTGSIQLDVGENPMLLLIMAQNGITVQQYILTINREADVPSATPSPSPTPGTSPSPTPSTTPSPTATPPPTATPAPTATPGTTVTPAPTQTSAPEATPTPSETPENTETPSETPAPSDTANPIDTSTPVPTATPVPSDDTTDSNPLMPVVYALAAIILLGGGVFAGIMFGKKNKK